MAGDAPVVGEFEQMILLAVLQRKDDAYGASIYEELARHTRRPVARGAVYMTLDRLEKKGLLRSTLTDPTPERGGRAKRCYAVTAAAVACHIDAHSAGTPSPVSPDTNSGPIRRAPNSSRQRAFSAPRSNFRSRGVIVRSAGVGRVVVLMARRYRNLQLCQ